MTAIEILERAISKLEQLREAEGFPWEVCDHNEGMSPPRPLWGIVNEAYLNPPEDDEAPWVAVEIHTGDKSTAELVVALSRTVEPMLAMLREALRMGHLELRNPELGYEVLIARAILGEENDRGE